MPRKGENIYKRKDGRWEARYIKGYTDEGKTKYGSCYALSYHEAKEKVSKIKAELVKRPPVKGGNTRVKFAFYCEEWLKRNRLKVKESTYVKYYAMINRHILPALGDCYVSRLSSALTEEFSRKLLKEDGLSPKSVRDILVVLKSILKYTRKNYSGIMEDIEIIYPKEVRKEMRVLSLAEQKHFMEFLLEDMDNIRFGILLTLMTGLRIGEICALRWADISLTEQVIRVGATMQRIQNMNENASEKTKIIISDPKSIHSVRVIPLTDHAVELCRMLGQQSPSAFVLSGSSDTFIEPRTLQYKLALLTKECGLKGVHYHTLRHTFATRCVEVDFEIKTLSEILGHSSPTITLERYVHTSIELKRNNMNKLASVGY